MVLDERGGATGDPPFREAADEAVSAGERRLAADPGDLRAMAAVGAARVLQSYVDASHHSYFQAAQEARRGKRLLERSLAGDPGLDLALFPLGALNYFADKVPLLVKGIRFLLFLPGGDADRGLEQLRSVAASSGPFRTDARLLLGLICASRQERCYTDGLAHLTKALQDNPGSPLIAGAIGEVQVRLGRYAEAAATYAQALEGISHDTEADRLLQQRWLRVALAEAWVGDWRIDQAEPLLAAIDADAAGMPAELLKIKARVAAELATKNLAGRRSTGPGAPPVSPIAAAAALLNQGRALYQKGDARAAEEALAAAEETAAELPPWMSGWIELYRGMAADGAGDRRAARAHFRRASEVRRFRSAERGLLELQRDGDPNPHCSP
jgi:tetratricopeptide (TPR) repeat protein